MILKIKRNVIASIAIIQSLALGFGINQNTTLCILIKSSILVLCFLWLVVPWRNLKCKFINSDFPQYILVLLSALLFQQTFYIENQNLLHLFFLFWMYIVYKASKSSVQKIIIALYVLITISCRGIIEWGENNTENYLMIISTTMIVVHYCIYLIKTKRKLQTHTIETKQIEVTQDFTSQRALKDRANTIRKSLIDNMYSNYSYNYMILDYIPLGIVLLNRAQEFQFMNDKSKEQLEAITGTEPSPENAVQLVTNVLKSAQTKQGVSPKQNFLRTPKTKLSRIVSSSMRMIEQSESQLYPYASKASHNIETSKFDKLKLSQQIDKQSQSDSKNIVCFTQNGKKKYVKLMFYENETANLVLIIIMDITKKVAHACKQQKLNFQNQLLNSFSHELRTPLNCTQQILESLKIKLSSEMVENYIKPIMNQNDLLLNQLNDILDFAAMEIGNFEQNYYSFSLKKLLRRCVNIFQSACQEKQIALSLNLPNIKFIKNDPQRIMQIIVNILNNSIKFTQMGGMIRISASVIEMNSQRMLNIKVKDNGIGMYEDQVQVLQDLINRPEEYLQEQYNMHIGLGLKVASRLAQTLNSERLPLNIKSKINLGFRVSFLVNDFEEANVQSQDDNEFNCLRNMYMSIPTAEFKFMKNVNCRCHKILLVDDIPFNHTSLQLLLQEMNFQADSAFDGAQAVKMVTERLEKNRCHPTYQLILMDIEMPIMNGFDASRFIKDTLKDQADQTAIVMCSAYDNLECRRMAKRCYMEDYLPKPISKSNLTQILSQYIK